MKRIPLTQNKFALVDDEDFETVAQIRWYAAKSGNTFYAKRTENGKNIFLHQFIAGENQDHINRNGLDNRRSNLRTVTHSQNMCNKPLSKNNKSGYRGVSWYKRANKWKAEIRRNNKLVYLGVFDDAKEASQAYEMAAKQCV